MSKEEIACKLIQILIENKSMDVQQDLRLLIDVYKEAISLLDQ